MYTRAPLGRRATRQLPLWVAAFSAIWFPLMHVRGADLASISLWLGVISFCFAVYLAMVVEPTPPYSHLATVIFLCYATAFVFLGAPTGLTPITWLRLRTVAIALLAVTLGVTWLLFVFAAQLKIRQRQNDE